MGSLLGLLGTDVPQAAPITEGVPDWTRALAPNSEAFPEALVPEQAPPVAVAYPAGAMPADQQLRFQRDPPAQLPQGLMDTPMAPPETLNKQPEPAGIWKELLNSTGGHVRELLHSYKTKAEQQEVKDLSSGKPNKYHWKKPVAEGGVEKGLHTFYKSLMDNEADEDGFAAYSSINRYNSGKYKGHTNARDFLTQALNNSYGTVDLTQRTLGELIDVGKQWTLGKGSGKDASSAMGFAQVTGTTMNELITNPRYGGKYNRDTVYTPEVQHEMVQDLLLVKRPSIMDYFRGVHQDKKLALTELGNEWEYYKKNPKEGARVLESLRKHYQSQNNKPASP